MSDMPPPPPDDSGWSTEPPPPPDDSSWSTESPPPPGPSAHGGAPPAGLTTLGTGESVELATPGLRLGAKLIDILIVLVGGFLINLFWPIIGFVAAGAAYEIAFVALKGQTLGKMATAVKIVRADNGLIPGWGIAAGRWAIQLVAYLLAIIPGLLLHASVAWDDGRQGWHDKAVKTLVVKA